MRLPEVVLLPEAWLLSSAVRPVALEVRPEPRLLAVRRAVLVVSQLFLALGNCPRQSYMRVLVLTLMKGAGGLAALLGGAA